MKSLLPDEMLFSEKFNLTKPCKQVTAPEIYVMGLSIERLRPWSIYTLIVSFPFEAVTAATTTLPVVPMTLTVVVAETVAERSTETPLIQGSEQSRDARLPKFEFLKPEAWYVVC